MRSSQMQSLKRNKTALHVFKQNLTFLPFVMLSRPWKGQGKQEISPWITVKHYFPISVFISQAQPCMMFPTVRSFCFSATLPWYSLQWSFSCSASVKAALEKTTSLSWITVSPYAWQSWAVSDVSKDKSWASVLRGKRQLRLLYPWLYISNRSLRHATR